METQQAWLPRAEGSHFGVLNGTLAGFCEYKPVFGADTK